LNLQDFNIVPEDVVPEESHPSMLSLEFARSQHLRGKILSRECHPSMLSLELARSQHLYGKVLLELARSENLESRL
jgi:hypothetical protein